MKRYFLKKWMMAILLAGACGTMTACDDNDNDGTTPPPTDPDIEAVCGAYRGTMTVVEAVPVADEGKDEPSGTVLDAQVTAAAIEFSDFPIRDLVIRVLGTEEGVDAIIEAIGTIKYAVPYSATMHEDKTAVILSLEPAALVLTLPDENEEGGEPTGVKIEAAVSATTAGTYTVESQKLGFGLSVSGIKVAGADLEGFEPFSLHFDLAKE